MPDRDLSHPIVTGMPTYPGDPSVRVSPAATLATDGVRVSHLELGSHTGTHVDAPAHVIPAGRTVDQIDPGQLIGPALVLRAANPRPTEPVVIDELPANLPRIVLLATGWDAHFDSPAALAHPYVSLELAQTLWSRGARVLGLDTVSPDCSDNPSHRPKLPVHSFWLGQDGLIVENLVGLVSLPPQVEVVMLPLNVVGGDGAPIRALAR